MDIKPYGKYAKAMIFLKWLLKAKTIDQLDSPILYEFYNQVVKSKVNRTQVATIEQLRTVSYTHLTLPTTPYV